MTDEARLKAFLDGLASLSARHGYAIESTPQGARLIPFDGIGGYLARPLPQSGHYDIDCYSAGMDRTDPGEEIVGEDWSPAAREDRARRWREENADAIAEHNAWFLASRGRLRGLLGGWDPIEDELPDIDDPKSDQPPKGGRS